MKHLITLIISFITFTPLWADDIRFTAQAPSVVSTGSQFRVTYTINAKPSKFKAPDFSDFEVLMGPSTSSSSSISIINGQISQEVSYSYTYILIANKEGKYTIPPAEVIVNGDTYKSNSLKIEVIKGQSNNYAGSSQQNTNTYDNVQPTQVSNDDIFIRVNVNKSNVFQGEQLVASIYIYTKLGIVGFEDLKFPTFKGFWSEEIENPNQINLKQEYINGQLYNVGLLKRVILSPQQTGTLTIDPVQATVIVQQRVQKRYRSIFDDFFGTYQNVPKKLVSPPVRINVKPLPENKPQPFSGGVGDFKLEASVSNSNVKTNEAFNYTIKLSGTGNLKLIDIPKPKFPTDFEVYEPKNTNNISVTGGTTSGSITTSYIIIPRHHGIYTIPGFDFNYFDTKTHSYKTIHINDFTINVSKDSANQSSVVISEFNKKDINILGSDIHFIKTNDKELTDNYQLLFSTSLYKWAYPISILAFLSLVYIRRNQIKQQSNIMALKNRKANKIANKRLSHARKLLKENNDTLFYEEIAKSLWGYLSDKLMIPVAELNKDKALEKLKNTSIPDEIINETAQLIDTCEYIRYAPSAFSSNKEELYNQTANIIKKLESNL